MKKRLLILLFILFTTISLASCQEEPKVTVTGISVVETSIPDSILTTEIDDKLDDIQITIAKSNDSTELINLSKSMIPSTDLAKLETAGEHTITVKHLGKETTFTIVVVEPQVEKEYFTVKVVYPDGTPVTSGVSVQWCTGNICKNPVVVDENGVATLEEEEGEFYIHIEGIPTGYTYNPNAYTTDTDNKHVEIKLITLLELTGEGTVDTPYVVSTGAYNVSYTEASTAGMKYFSFTPTEAGSYSISSLAMDKLALNPVDPYIGYLGTTKDMANIDVSSNQDSEVNINFTHTFEAEANTTYYFIIMVSANQKLKFPAAFDFEITKN